MRRRRKKKEKVKEAEGRKSDRPLMILRGKRAGSSLPCICWRKGKK
jgi:hypothetical protein